MISDAFRIALRGRTRSDLLNKASVNLIQSWRLSNCWSHNFSSSSNTGPGTYYKGGSTRKKISVLGLRKGLDNVRKRNGAIDTIATKNRTSSDLLSASLLDEQFEKETFSTRATLHRGFNSII